LFENRVVTREGRINDGEVSLIREVEKVELNFPRFLAEEDIRIPSELGWDDECPTKETLI